MWSSTLIDEFVVLLIDTDQEFVQRKIEHIQQAIAALRVDGMDAATTPLGISIGCATYGADGQDTDTLLTTADAAMYRAKSERKRADALAI